MIDLQDEIVAVVFVADGERKRIGSVDGGGKESREDFCKGRIDLSDRGSGVGERDFLRVQDVLLRGHEQGEVRADAFSLAFVSAEKEGTALDYGAPKRASEIVVREMRLRIA